MRKKFIVFSCFILIFCAPSLQSLQVINATKAGSWYPEERESLSALLDSYLQKAKTGSIPSGEIIALISPHAGYACSGQIAAYGYRLVQDKGYETVVIIAPTHTVGFEGCSIYPKGGYKTPLGVTEIDSALAGKLTKVSGFSYIPEAHVDQHTIEMQVPFIQKVLPEARIVLIVMGTPNSKTIKTLAKALGEVVNEKKVLIVVSTDMSHYEPQIRANEIDQATVALIESFRTSDLIKKVERHENILCGGGAVIASLLYAQEKGRAKAAVLKYGDSTACGSSPSEVVGYLSAALMLEPPSPEFSLSPEEKGELLKLASSAVSQYVRERTIVAYQPHYPQFSTKKGAFVTLKRNGRLRGCIGIVEPLFPLYEAIIRAAISAACSDPRFPQVSPEELPDLEVEISVLTPLKKVQDPKEVEVGKHGIIISQNGRSGLLLPQVPVENNWTRIKFLEEGCLKAGLPKNSWKKGAEIFVFEAIVFH